MSSRSIARLVALVLSWAYVCSVSLAEEGGSGHYIPGSMASFADAVPPKEAFVARYNLLYYGGDLSLNRSLPLAGRITAGAEVESWAQGLTLLWRPPLELGENISYAMSSTVPFVDVNVSAEVTAGGTTVRRSDSDRGLGDVVLMPVMLNYAFSRDFSTNFRLGVYAPTGDYERGRLANTGKNFWTIEPTLALGYFGQENGREASLFAGVDLNTENKDTDYQSGAQIHFDGTLAQHLPLLGGLVGGGVSGFWYKQVEADTGGGATLGAFKAMTTGFGPVLSYAYTGDEFSIVSELKWLREFDTVNRLEGDYVWLKVLVKF